MVTYRFIYNAKQLEILNSIIVGMVEICLTEQIKYVPGYLICKPSGFLVIFEANNLVRTVSVQRTRLKESSRLLTNNNLSIGCFAFNLGSQIGLDFYAQTGLLFQGMPSKVYDDSMYQINMPTKVSGGFLQFNLLDLVFNQAEEINSGDFKNLALNLSQTLPLNVKILGAYVLTMIQSASTIANCFDMAASGDQQVIDLLGEVIVKAEIVKEQFSNYLSSLEDAQSNVPTIKIVEQEAQKLLPFCSEENNTIKQEVIAVEIPDEAYIYYDADFGYFENEARELVKTNDQEKSEEIVVNTINTNNTEVKTMKMKFKKSVPDLLKGNKGTLPGFPNTPFEWFVEDTKKRCPSINLEKFFVDYELYGLDEIYYKPGSMISAADPFMKTRFEYEHWLENLIAKHKEEISKPGAKKYIPYNANLEIISDEPSNFQDPSLFSFKKRCSAYVAKLEARQHTNTNTNTNTEVKPMTSFQAKIAALQAELDKANAEAEDDAIALAEAYAQADLEDNIVADANGQEKSEEIATTESTNTNSIPNNKTMDNVKPSARKLVSIELVVNIIAAIGGDCARKSHSVAKRTEKLNVLRNKNSKTISNVRGYGAIRTNSNDGSCFLDVNVFPETAMTVYNTNNRPVIIFHYDDNTQAIQSEANTEKFWRKVLHTSEEAVIPFLNPTLKVDLPANADTLCERIDAGTIQAVSIKFTNMDKKMFTYYSSDVSGRFIVYLKAAGDYDVSLLRDTVEVSDNFLNYNGEKGAINNFAGASKTGRSGNNVAVVARPQVAAAQSNLFGMPSTAEVSKVVETVAPVAVVIDTEKETLRAENVALKAEVSELKTQIAELTAGQARMEAKLTAGQARMEALMEQLVAAQAVKTEEVSIPEIIEVVAPVVPAEVVETEEQQLARLEQERMNFFRACEYDNYEATGEETLDSDQYAELNKLDEEIKTLKWLMNIPVADRAAAIEARNAEKAAAIAENTKAYADFMSTGIVSDNLFG